jgi:hypothetical protein
MAGDVYTVLTYSESKECDEGDWVTAELPAQLAFSRLCDVCHVCEEKVGRVVGCDCEQLVLVYPPEQPHCCTRKAGAPTTTLGTITFASYAATSHSHITQDGR